MLISWEKNPSKDFFSTYQYSDYNSLFLKNNLITKIVNLYQEKTKPRNIQMSYGKFQKEAGIYSKWRDKNNLPHLGYERIDEIIRDEWIKDKRYKVLIAFILENWDSGNCDDFSTPLCKHLIVNKELILFKRLWKGIIRHRLDKFWEGCEYFKQKFPQNTVNVITNFNLKNFNQFSADDSIERRIAWNRFFIIEGISEFIKGLEFLNDDEEIIKQKALLQKVLNLESPKPKDTTDKRKIDESLFWELINDSRKISENQYDFIDNLKSILETFYPQEIRNFDKILITKANELNTWEHWALAYIVRSGCGDDEFDYFRVWSVSKGKKAFLAIKEIEESKLLQIFDEDPQLEEFYYLAESVYEEKTSELMQPVRVKSSKISGKRWEEDNLKQIFPTLCKLLKYE